MEREAVSANGKQTIRKTCASGKGEHIDTVNRVRIGTIRLVG